jgi:hypothetical protein
MQSVLVHKHKRVMSVLTPVRMAKLNGFIPRKIKQTNENVALHSSPGPLNAVRSSLDIASATF